VIPHGVTQKTQEPEVVFEVEETVRSIEQPKRIAPETRKKEEIVRNIEQPQRIVPQVRKPEEPSRSIQQSRRIVPEVRRQEETVINISQPKRIVPEVRRQETTARRQQTPARRQEEARRQQEEARIQEERRILSSQAVQSVLPPQSSFNQILPTQPKAAPANLTPSNFKLPSFFSFTFSPFKDQTPGPGSYAYSVGL